MTDFCTEHNSESSNSTRRFKTLRFVYKQNSRSIDIHDDDDDNNRPAAATDDDGDDDESVDQYNKLYDNDMSMFDDHVMLLITVWRSGEGSRGNFPSPNDVSHLPFESQFIYRCS